MENQQEKIEWEEGLRINGGTEDGYSGALRTEDHFLHPKFQKYIFLSKQCCYF